MRRMFAWLVGLPAAIILILLAVANRSPVTLSLDPFSAESPAWTVTLPLFGVIFLAIIAGIFIGGVATWFGQGRWRKAARLRRYEISDLKAQSERLRRAGEPQPLALPHQR